MCLLSAVYIYTRGPCFVSECVQPLSLLTGAFNPFTFKVVFALHVLAVILLLL